MPVVKAEANDTMQLRTVNQQINKNIKILSIKIIKRYTTLSVFCNLLHRSLVYVGSAGAAESFFFICMSL